MSGGTALAGEVSGEGVPVVLLHGLTATRRYVVMGSTALQRSGHRVIAYDARGHGASAPAADGDYGYPRLAADIGEVLDAAGVARAVLAGASMGAHSAVRFALEQPERVAALVLITPAFDPRAAGLARGPRGMGRARTRPARGRRRGLRRRPTGWTPWRPSCARRSRPCCASGSSAHAHPAAVADALEAVPRSRPFASAAELGAIDVPVTVVASRDGPDPGHPLAVGEAWSRWIPGARLVVEEQATPPRSPIAWQGGQLSRVIAETAADART